MIRMGRGLLEQRWIVEVLLRAFQAKRFDFGVSDKQAVAYFHPHVFDAGSDLSECVHIKVL